MKTKQYKCKACKGTGNTCLFKYARCIDSTHECPNCGGTGKLPLKKKPKKKDFLGRGAFDMKILSKKGQALSLPEIEKHQHRFQYAKGFSDTHLFVCECGLSKYVKEKFS